MRLFCLIHLTVLTYYILRSNTSHYKASRQIYPTTWAVVVGWSFVKDFNNWVKDARIIIQADYLRQIQHLMSNSMSSFRFNAILPE